MALAATYVACPLAIAAAQTPRPTYDFVLIPPPTTGTPRILKVQLNSDHLSAHGPIAIRVSTTRDVVSVVTGRGHFSGTLTRVAPGVFTSESTLPRIRLPFGAAHFKIHFEATTASGKEASLDVPVTYR
jgi:hypothetical protein